jgi:pyruvate formate lyase activating enzyme
MTAAQVVDRVARDKDFYDNSGGGVTFSGGEPFCQPQFLLALLKGCRQRGLRTAVETCGQAQASDIVAAASLVDLFLFDIKVVDPEQHKRWTGMDNGLILSNLRWLVAQHASRLVVRFPVVPGCTDSDQNVQALATLVQELGLTQVQLQPYHGLGAFKYRELGRIPPALSDSAVVSEERLAAIRSIFHARGIGCVSDWE